jgi:hypothetical protein
MTVPRHRTIGWFRRLAVLLGAFGLLLRAVIAPGVMPDPYAAAQGTFKLVICTGEGIQERSGQPDNGSTDPVHRGDHALCPYNAAGHVATAASDIPSLAAPLPRRFEIPAAQRIAPRILLHTPGARAPPRIA